MKNYGLLIIFMLNFGIYFPNTYSQNPDKIPKKQLFLIAGQSNAVGQGNSKEAPSCEGMPCYGYDDMADQIIPLKEPCGTTRGLFQKAQSGSIASAFAGKYAMLSGDTVCIISAARGGASCHYKAEMANYDTWDAKGKLFKQAVEKCNRASHRLNAPLTGIIWMQGERDANAIVNGELTASEYKEALKSVITRFRNEFGASLPFYIVLTGYQQEGRDPKGCDAVRLMQQQVAREICGVEVVYARTDLFPGKGWYKDFVHYNQQGLNDIGVKSAESIFSCLAKPAFVPGKDFPLSDMVQTIPVENVMADSAWNIWCGSMTKGFDNKYHLYYSRWPRSTRHEGWITHSEIAYAVADRPEGPYTPVNVALERDDSTRWDGTMNHNPCIVAKDGTYYLYYIGTQGRVLPDNEVVSAYGTEWWRRRNTQRIGVATSNNPAGPWKRSPNPILANNPDTTAFDAMCVTNPAVCVGRNGKIVMLYKAVCKNGTNKGGRVRFSVAFADHPEGPFIKSGKQIFIPDNPNAQMVAEDPYIWFDEKSDMYYAIVRDVIKIFTGKESGGLALMESKDAIEWKATANPKVLPPVLHWSDGTTYNSGTQNVERPWLYRDENGVPTFLFGTMDVTNRGIRREFSYNVRIPLCLPPNQATFDNFSYSGSDSCFDKQINPDKQTFNPILPGFYPDPSICRKGEDYYLINSTFSYFPGIPIFHSRNLTDWTQIGHVLDRPSQLKLDNLPLSGGVFAPAIEYNRRNETFYVVNTVVGGINNFYVKTQDPLKGWSEPVKLPNVQGIDPSFFFDEDGKSYLLCSHKPPVSKWNGHRAIYMHEFDAVNDCTVGDPLVIVDGGANPAEQPRWLEGPHLYKVKGKYILIMAEGGTHSGHRQVAFSADHVKGPYKACAINPILTQLGLPEDRPDKVTNTGHADLIEAPDGKWYAMFLACRPYDEKLYNTGRETFMLPVEWKKGTPVILPKGKCVNTVIDRPFKSSAKADTPSQAAFMPHGNFVWKDDFEENKLAYAWCMLRTPHDQWYSLQDGKLKITPKEVTLSEKGNPAFLCRRQQHLNFNSSVELKYTPLQESELAGIVLFQNENNYFVIGKTIRNQRPVVILEEHRMGVKKILKEVLLSAQESNEPLTLTIEGKGASANFKFTVPSSGKQVKLSDQVDITNLSTHNAGGFVGSMIGLYATK